MKTNYKIDLIEALVYLPEPARRAIIEESTKDGYYAVDSDDRRLEDTIYQTDMICSLLYNRTLDK